MIKALQSITITLVLSLLLVTHVQALDLGFDRAQKAATDPTYGAGYDVSTDDTSFAKLVGTAIRAMLALLGIFFTGLMIYAGDLWLTARGNQDQIDKAKKMIIGAVIGLIIVMAAYTISNFAVSALLEEATGIGDSF